jgi:hypothetical protein
MCAHNVIFENIQIHLVSLMPGEIPITVLRVKVTRLMSTARLGAGSREQNQCESGTGTVKNSYGSATLAPDFRYHLHSKLFKRLSHCNKKRNPGIIC